MSLSAKLILLGGILVVVGPLLVMMIRRLVRGEAFEDRGVAPPPSGFDPGGQAPIDGGP